MTGALITRLEELYAHGHARPVERLHGDWRDIPAEGLRPAAVLIAVTDRGNHPDGPGVLLIQRPSNMRAHPGQAAFPGGKLDPGESAIDAALREAEEELGIRAADVRVIGATDRFRTGTGYDVTPVLATIPADLPLKPNPAEVADWFEPPFGFILDAANHARKSAMFGGAERAYIEIMWHGHRIWGVTAAIIANLAKRIDWHGAAA